MTPGSFEALTTNPAVFLQPIESFDRVIGRVDGGMLYLESENVESSARVSWMVLAERYDANMVTSTTNYQGHLVTEQTEDVN